VHLVAHSAGAILIARLLSHLTRSMNGHRPVPIRSATLWAPACTMRLFDEHFAPALTDGRLGHLALYTLTDDCEQGDNCAGIYNKSLLYLVSNAFESRVRIPIIRPDGEPLLGMARFIEKSAVIRKLINNGKLTWIQAPNSVERQKPEGSRASSHGGFDDDRETIASTISRITGHRKNATDDVCFRPGMGRTTTYRTTLDVATGPKVKMTS
jgi:hypothetical protein